MRRGHVGQHSISIFQSRYDCALMHEARFRFSRRYGPEHRLDPHLHEPGHVWCGVVGTIVSYFFCVTLA